MKTRSLLCGLIFVAGAFAASAQDLEFTTSGSAAEYITWNNRYSHQADSLYEIKKIEDAGVVITIDGVADEAIWSTANAVVIKKIAHEKTVDGVLELSNYPQSDTDLKATFHALWTNEGVYMFIDVVDDFIRYQNAGAPWENDGIEFYFAKERGEGKIQLILPAFIGTPHPDKPAATEYMTGSGVGSSSTGPDQDYIVFGYDTEGWDETLFSWAMKRNASGYTIEIYMDKDIVTNGNSATNYGLDKMFAGDVNVNESDDKQNTNDPALYVREGSLALLSNSNQSWAGSANYGHFKMVPGLVSIRTTLSITDLVYDMKNSQIYVRNNEINTVDIFNSLGQRVVRSNNSDVISVGNLTRGVYVVKATDAKGNNIGVRKIMIQ